MVRTMLCNYDHSLYEVRLYTPYWRKVMFSTFIAWWLGLYVVVMTIDLFTDPVVNSEFGIGGKLLWFIMGIVLWPISAVTVFIRLTWDQRSIDLMDEWTANEVERLRAERGKGKEEEKLNSFWDDFNNDE